MTTAPSFVLLGDGRPVLVPVWPDHFFWRYDSRDRLKPPGIQLVHIIIDWMDRLDLPDGQAWFLEEDDVIEYRDGKAVRVFRAQEWGRLSAKGEAR
jgi:hypothetical protein